MLILSSTLLFAAWQSADPAKFAEFFNSVLTPDQQSRYVAFCSTAAPFRCARCREEVWSDTNSPGACRARLEGRIEFGEE